MTLARERARPGCVSRMCHRARTRWPTAHAASRAGESSSSGRSKVLRAQRSTSSAAAATPQFLTIAGVDGAPADVGLTMAFNVLNQAIAIGLGIDDEGAPPPPTACRRAACPRTAGRVCLRVAPPPRRDASPPHACCRAHAVSLLFAEDDDGGEDDDDGDGDGEEGPGEGREDDDFGGGGAPPPPPPSGIAVWV